MGGYKENLYLVQFYRNLKYLDFRSVLYKLNKSISFLDRGKREGTKGTFKTLSKFISVKSKYIDMSFFSVLEFPFLPVNYSPSKIKI